MVFKESRRKIVAAIMLVLVLLFLGTLAVIYISSYYEVSANNREMLERYAELYSLESHPGNDEPLDGGTPSVGMEHHDDVYTDNAAPGDKPGGPHFENTPAFQLSTFYSVAISDGGVILAIDNSGRDIYTDTELEGYALQIVKSGRSNGIKDNLIYIALDKGGYTLVAFMDNTIMQKSMTTLFRYTLVFGATMIIALFFVAVYLARRIVRPLEESYRKQKQFISDAGHELKTPVSVVSANAELLVREIGDNQWLSNIQYENERMGVLIRQLLELARTENTVRQTERLDLSRLVSGEALPFESVVFEKGLALDCDIADDIFLEGSSAQLKQLVSILLDNAAQYSKGGKKITLRLSEERGFAKLTVINSGEEIPADRRRQLFDRFYRIDSARNGEGGHYGLGLAIAKAICTAHRGKIDVYCYDGMVEFSVLLPLKK